MDTFRLCYVTGDRAWFTSRAITDQWGDDWNDAPYWCNAGDPYGYGDHNKKRGDAPWKLLFVGWRGEFTTPEERGINCSVQLINAEEMAWLRDNTNAAIAAGASLADFVKFIKHGGGEVVLSGEFEEQGLI